MRDTRKKKFRIKDYWYFDDRWYDEKERADRAASLQGLHRQHQSQIHLPVKPLHIGQTMRSVNRNR